MCPPWWTTMTKSRVHTSQFWIVCSLNFFLWESAKWWALATCPFQWTVPMVSELLLCTFLRIQWLLVHVPDPMAQIYSPLVHSSYCLNVDSNDPDSLLCSIQRLWVHTLRSDDSDLISSYAHNFSHLRRIWCFEGLNLRSSTMIHLLDLTNTY